MANLKDLMTSLYETGNYFVEANEYDLTDYDESYWGEIVDPDGKKRNLLLEIDQQVEDTNYIWEFINISKYIIRYISKHKRTKRS